MINRLAVVFEKHAYVSLHDGGEFSKWVLLSLPGGEGLREAVIPGQSCPPRGTSELLNVGQALSWNSPSCRTWVSGAGAFGLMLWPRPFSPHEPHRSQSQLSWKELPHDKSESLKTLLRYHDFLRFRGSPYSEEGAKARYWALSLFPFTCSGFMKTPWVWFGLVWTSDTGNKVVRPYNFPRPPLVDWEKAEELMWYLVASPGPLTSSNTPFLFYRRWDSQVLFLMTWKIHTGS